MLEQIVGSSMVNALSGALGAAELRHKVISNNIANVNTPHFKKSVVDFEELLAKELQPDTNKLALTKTNAKHLPLSKSGGVSPEIRTINNTTMRTDGNNVDIDEEMAGLAKNNIYYNAVARQIGSYFNTMKSIASGQK